MRLIKKNDELVDMRTLTASEDVNEMYKFKQAIEKLDNAANLVREADSILDDLIVPGDFNYESEYRDIEKEALGIEPNSFLLDAVASRLFEIVKRSKEEIIK